MDRRRFLIASAASLVRAPARAAAPRVVSRPGLEVEVDFARDIGPLAHNWENCVGSDRLAVGLREQWLKDLSTTHALCGFQSVRCHGLFDDEMGICPEVRASGPVTSFVYLDQVYDRLLEIGVRPFVELSFMPTALASSRNAVFWYRGNTSPPRRMSDWSALVAAFAQHLVKRYGIAEVSQWRFECWNEPNLNFWAGTQAQYFELYRQTSNALKGVDRRLQVGGPATAQMMWVPEFLAYCARERVPVDFVSSHIYADDPQENIFGKPNLYPFEEVIPRALARAQAQIRDSSFHELPLLITEWSSQNPAFIVQTVRDCLGLAATLSYWTFDAVFEEQGTPRTFFNDAYGLIGQSGVPRPALHAFTALHRLGPRRLRTGSGPVLASRREDGSSALLAWNLMPKKTRTSAAGTQRLSLQLKGSQARSAELTLIDPAKASPWPAYDAMGRPAYPSREQIDELTRSAAIPRAETQMISGGVLTLDLPANALALIEFPAS
jgi:xylan 1,4-beta-xylosidase